METNIFQLYLDYFQVEVAYVCGIINGNIEANGREVVWDIICWSNYDALAVG